MSFLNPITPDEYRAKHPTCAVCRHSYLHGTCDKVFMKCRVSRRRVFATLPRPFCRTYTPAPFRD